MSSSKSIAAALLATVLVASSPAAASPLPGVSRPARPAVSMRPHHPRPAKPRPPRDDRGERRDDDADDVIGRCFQDFGEVFGWNDDLRIIGRLNTLNNAQHWSSLDGTCSGNLNLTFTVVSAPSAVDAGTQCQTLGAGGGSVLNFVDYGYSTVPVTWYRCL